MAKRRSRGDGGLHWDERRQRWIATVTIGFDARGKRITRKASGITKTEAKDKLKEILEDHRDGVSVGPLNYTVADAVESWLAYGLSCRAASTVANYRCLAEQHVNPAMGSRKLRELSAEDVDRWLKAKSKTLSTRTLRLLHSILCRAVRHAQARDKVKRNVVALCDVPTGTRGRPSKSLTLDQAVAVLAAAEKSAIYAYIVLSLLIGARTEELRALRWRDVDIDGDPKAEPPIPPSISVLRSVREDGDTKTRKSRRRLAMPIRCVDALVSLRQRTGGQVAPDALVFVSRAGTALDSHNVRRAFRRVVKAAGLPAKEWTPRELRHSFVSLLSDAGMPLENISRLVGHSGTAVTEIVYRHQLRPVLEDGATTMDRIFPSGTAEAS